MILVISFCFIEGYSQLNARHGLNSYASIGRNKEDILTKQIEIGYQLHISKGLYLTSAFMTTNGSKSLVSILGEEPNYINNRINDIIAVSKDDIGNIFGKIYQSKTWALGLKKYIRTG